MLIERPLTEGKNVRLRPAVGFGEEQKLSARGARAEGAKPYIVMKVAFQQAAAAVGP